MKKAFKKYFIPHLENDHKPHFLREKSVFVTSLLIIALFGFSLLGNFVVKNNNYLASIQAAFLVDLANEDREDIGLNQLVINDKLILAADLKAKDMSSSGYFAHVSPEGRTPWSFIDEAGYNYLYAGENLAVNFYDSEDVQDAWMDSPTHRANILSKNFTEIGIATARGKYKGENTTFVVQMFGSPKKVVASETPVREVLVSNVGTEEETLNNDLEDESGSEVLGTEVEVVTSTSENNSLMTFTNPNATEEEINQNSSDISVNRNTENKQSYTNWFERLIVSPSNVVQGIYTVIMAIIVFSLILKIFIEIRKQHPKNIAYGVLMLAIVLIFMHLNSKGIADPTIVVSL